MVATSGNSHCSLDWGNKKKRLKLLTFKLLTLASKGGSTELKLRPLRRGHCSYGPGVPESRGGSWWLGPDFWAGGSSQLELASLKRELQRGRNSPYLGEQASPCYQVQASSAHHTTGQWIERRGDEAKNMTLFGKLADQIDGRLTSQSNHLIGAWMPGSFIESERETQGGSKVERQNREGDVMGK